MWVLGPNSFQLLWAPNGQGRAGPKVVVNSQSGDVNRVMNPFHPLPALMKALDSVLCIFSGFWAFEPQRVSLRVMAGRSPRGLGE